MGHLSVLLLLTEVGCIHGPQEIPAPKANPTPQTQAERTLPTTRRKAHPPAATRRKPRPSQGARKRRAALKRALKNFQKRSPIQLGRAAKKPLPKARQVLWAQLLTDCGRWASRARGSKDGQLAMQLAHWLEDQRALEKRRYHLTRQLELSISEQIRFASSRAELQPVVIHIRQFQPRWPVKDIVVTSFFGPRKDPIKGTQKTHEGIDFAVASGTPVYAVAAGTVAQSERRGSYGELIVVRHSSGWESRYAHLQKRRVNVGNRVAAGQIIGRSGNSGRSTGPHLHLELRRSGRAVDPLSLAGWH